MGTRGLFGFRWKGVYYLMYNHWDSYPSGLGRALLEELLKAVWREWFRMFRRLRLIRDEDPVRKKDIRRLEKWTDLTVGSQTTQDWYCLLRKCQGSMKAVLESGYMLLHGEYRHPHEWNDVFIEYVYVVNFDNGMFEWFDGAHQLGAARLNRLPPDLFLNGVIYNEEMLNFSDFDSLSSSSSSSSSSSEDEGDIQEKADMGGGVHFGTEVRL